MKKLLSALAIWRTVQRRREHEQRRRRAKVAAIATGGALMAGLLALIEQRRRRNGTLAAAVQHGAREAAAKVTPTSYDDKTLEAKVQTELFRPKDAPKDKVNVQVVDGVVELRGKLDAAKAAELASQAQDIEGVSGVRNLINTAA